MGCRGAATSQPHAIHVPWSAGVAALLRFAGMDLQRRRRSARAQEVYLSVLQIVHAKTSALQPPLRCKSQQNSRDLVWGNAKRNAPLAAARHRQDHGTLSQRRRTVRDGFVKVAVPLLLARETIGQASPGNLHDLRFLFLYIYFYFMVHFTPALRLS